MSITADTSWYNENDTEFTLYTPAQLKGLVELSRSNTFQGKTIKLGADLRFNAGRSCDWAHTPPENVWNPIAPDPDVCFHGTFDGCGHVIAGLYSRAAEEATLGLFAFTAGATIKNFCLTNSYFRNDMVLNYHTHTGAVIGSAFGCTLENIYTDAILDGGRDLGMVAFFRNYDLTIRKCWFDGVILPPADSAFYAGGLLGQGYYASSGPLNGALIIDNCLFTGEINGGKNGESTSYVGGLVGMAPTGLDASDKTNITNCISCGKILTEATGAGSLMGTCSWRGGFTIISNLYAAEECYKNASGKPQAVIPARDTPTIILGSYMLLPLDELMGEKAADNTPGLDYESVWVAATGSTPEIRTVTKTPYTTSYSIDYGTLIDILDRIRELNGTERSYTALEIPECITQIYNAGFAAGRNQQKEA